jgi:CRP-like cAMP-binding protein
MIQPCAGQRSRAHPEEMMSDFAFLQQVDLFKNLPESHLASLQPCCQERSFQRGDRLFGQGDSATHLWVVKEGQVDLCLDMCRPLIAAEGSITTVETAMIFGWSSLVPPGQYLLSAYCASRACRALLLEADCLKRLFEADPLIGYQVTSRLLQVVGKRFHQLQQELTARRRERP